MSCSICTEDDIQLLKKESMIDHSPENNATYYLNNDKVKKLSRGGYVVTTASGPI